MECLRSCILCNNKRFFKIGSRGRFNLKVNIVVCLRCGLVFEKLRMDENERMEFYSSKYHSIYSKKDILEVDLGREKSLERIAFLKNYAQIKGKKILEVGCSNGMFLKLCKENNAITLGIEPFRNYSEYAKKQFGLDIFTGTLELYKKNNRGTGNKFDIICLFHVLEHLPNPKRELKWFHNRLNQNGILYLEVPNTLTFWRWFNQSPKKFMRPVHLFNFSWITLDCFLKKSSFKVIAKDRNVPRRIRMITIKSTSLNYICEKDNPYFVIFFFCLWPVVYLITMTIKIVLKRFRKLIHI